MPSVGTATASPAAELASPAPTAIPTLETLPEGPAGHRDSPLSPDGAWLVRHLTHDRVLEVQFAHGPHPYLYHSQSLVAADGTITRTFRGAWVPDGLGVSWPAFVGWALDGSAAYTTMSGTPDGGCTANGWSEAIWKVAVPSGMVTVVGEVPGLPVLSPDGRRIGGVTVDGEGWARFSWIETERGKQGQSHFPMPATESGAVAELAPPRWSSDGRAVIVRVDYDPCQGGDLQRLLYHMLGTESARTILEAQSDGMLWIEDWLPDDTLIVRDRPSWWADSAEPRQWRIDARTGQAR